jgi:HAD superfamily hydrolase (TIGR01490 family)
MSRVAALFDLDNTLLDTSSGQLYARYLHRHGKMGWGELVRVTWWGLLRKLGVLDMQDLIPRLLSGAAGDNEREMRQLCDRWFAEDVVPHVTERGRQQVADHQAQGHVVALVSASTQYVVEPMAAYLGIPGQFVCTHLVSKNGHLTGEVVPPVCYGEGKVTWAERFAAEHDVDLAVSYFYTDSISDLPLLERVGQPVVVNPDLKLKQLALQRGWPIEMFY